MNYTVCKLYLNQAVFFKKEKIKLCELQLEAAIVLRFREEIKNILGNSRKMSGQ